ncbi:MAG TPA: hypothetical protein VGK32_06750 [Vicinamibacterales bacterium]|jgi:hypothetical protein
MERQSWIHAVLLLAAAGILVGSTAALGSPPTGRPRSQAAPTVRPAASAGQAGHGVLFETRMTVDGGTQLLAESPGVRYEKTVYSDHLEVVLAAENERVVLRADASGSLSVTRDGRTRALSATKLTKRDLLQVRNLLAGSDVVAAFRLLAGELEDDDSPAAESTSVTAAMVGLLDGDVGAPNRMVQRILRKHGARLRQVVLQRTARDCWESYRWEALRIAEDTADCAGRQRWNPIWQSACGAEFIIRAELNWFWVIACSGGFPGQ